MAEWRPTPAADVEAGATVRLADGRELVVSRIEADFFGVPTLVAFIEDTSRQWFKAPMSADTTVDVLIEP
jgi:hypothetical protein